ncbi:MAG TPA: hypothetical protein PLV48_10965 [Rhodocyclaceae bacterium]|nr:hypothetical protein [Rhodocyclaceae bacterium]HNH98826.1 hypothetical protein [Rhodocyclaceae bacterium]
MDLSRFIQLVNDPRRTKDELRNMLNNAVQNSKPDYARAAKDALDGRFPGWNDVRAKRVGATPTRVVFRGVERRYETAKDAYTWLIERFIEAHPEPFINLDWEIAFVAKGRQRNYFGRTLKRMFHGSPHLADDANNFARLTNGWYVNLNLSNDKKFAILCNFAAVGKFKYGEEWTWSVEGRGSDS